MSYANPVSINIKTERKTKTQAQELAEELGFNLSTLINAYLKQFIRTKRVSFRIDIDNEEPSEYLIESIRRAEDDIREGRLSPPFTSANAAATWLDQQL